MQGCLALFHFYIIFDDKNHDINVFVAVFNESKTKRQRLCLKRVDKRFVIIIITL